MKEVKETNQSSKRSKSRVGIRLTVLAGLCLAAFAACLLFGSVRITGSDFLAAFSGVGEQTMPAKIIRDIRMPRALAAFFLGGALALAGYLMQTFFHNPLAGPFVLGISSGAKLTVAMTLVFCLGRSLQVSSWMLIAAAFAGALLSMGVVAAFAGKVREMTTLIICGVMIGYVCSALTDLVITFANDADIVNLHNWALGSFSGISWSQIRVLVPVVLVSAVGVFCLIKPISVYLSSEEYAHSVGVNVKNLRRLFVLLACFLSGAVVAFAGPVSFVGIAVPYLVKRVLKTQQPLWVIPGCFLGGGFLCLSCDLIARCVFAPVELSISTVTALFLAPVVLLMLMKRKGDRLYD